MILRPYQTDLVNNTRDAFLSGCKSVCVQLPTGGGKTPVQVSIIDSISENGKRVWHISPRHEIQDQVSKHFQKYGITHGFIDAKNSEQRAFHVHIVSKDTLTRRWNKIKNPPDYAIIDECHLNYDFQMEFKSRFPECRLIGYTATPERLSGESLNDIYDSLVEGESIPSLMSAGYLSPLRYYAPPIQGLESVHRKGTEYNPDELEALLLKRKVYGEAIEHYRKYADGKPALIFCRSIKSAEETAHRFSAAGYKFENLDGSFTMSERKAILDALRDGKIHGVCSVDLFLYGLDIPRIEVGICLRPTLSRALYMQMIGRILRPYDGKESAIFFDHVGNLYEHQESGYPGVPLHYLPHIKWNFNGKQKREREKTDERLTTLRLCPVCYMYFEGRVCPTCGNVIQQKQREELKQVESELKELNPVSLADRPDEERKEYQDRIGVCIQSGAVGDMLKIAHELGYPPMWAYHKLNGEKRISVNISLLSEIARIQGYKPGWVWIQKQKLKGRV
jgi:DNA repair protein RadD